VFLKLFVHELYNKNNYLGVKKLFHLNLSILSVFFIFFSKCDIFNFFQNYLKKKLDSPSWKWSCDNGAKKI